MVEGDPDPVEEAVEDLNPAAILISMVHARVPVAAAAQDAGVSGILRRFGRLLGAVVGEDVAGGQSGAGAPPALATPRTNQGRDSLSPRIDQGRDSPLPRMKQGRDSSLPRIDQGRDSLSPRIN